MPSYIWLTASSYFLKYLRNSSYTVLGSPFLIYDFAPDPVWISLYMSKIFNLFYQCKLKLQVAHYLALNRCYGFNLSWVKRKSSKAVWKKFTKDAHKKCFICNVMSWRKINKYSYFYSILIFIWGSTYHSLISYSWKPWKGNQ